PSELPRIFDRFYRGSRSNEARGSGSGLGLAIVKSIVDMHGGRVSVESLVGRGTTFTVTVAEKPAEIGGTLEPTDVGEPAVPVAIPVHGASLPLSGTKMADSSPSPEPSLNVPRSG
ncbi:MAG: ATP-binding protein, partial [Candidatus Limnocylindrales bacterium]